MPVLDPQLDPWPVGFLFCCSPFIGLLPLVSERLLSGYGRSLSSDPGAPRFAD
ncbi:hypothetical protein [Streptomyces chryseus]